MLGKILSALFMVTVSVGLVAAEEYQAVITKVDGDKVTIQKMKGKGKDQEKDGEPITLPVTKDVKVNKGKINFKEKKLEVGDAIESGLKNEMFSKISDKGLRARVTTDADNKNITEIVTISFGKKKNNQ